MTDKKQAQETGATPKADDPVVVEAPDPSASETVPGGRYLVNDQLVDANGKPVKG